VLDARRCGLLWPYHSGGLATATDSGLVLLGYREPSAVEALESFADADLGYVPQLCSSDQVEGHMPVSTFNRHWCQVDYGTTCLVLALRREAGLPVNSRLRGVLSGYETRGGLFFANPYLTDWLLAMALGSDEETLAARTQLAAEILTSAHGDGSFGAFDPALSTAFAILALGSLGIGGPQVEAGKKFLVQSIEEDGCWPTATPFYSSVILPSEHFDGAKFMGLAFGDRVDQAAMIRQEIHAITLYRDDARLITTAAAVLALHQPHRAETGCPSLVQVHARYRSASVVDYAADFGLPPYVGGGWHGKFAEPEVRPAIGSNPGLSTS
jgi:hypothetical protein